MPTLRAPVLGANVGSATLREGHDFQSCQLRRARMNLRPSGATATEDIGLYKASSRAFGPRGEIKGRLSSAPLKWCPDTIRRRNKRTNCGSL